MDLDERKRRVRSVDRLPTSLRDVVCGLVQSAFWSWGPGLSNKLEEGDWDGKNYEIHSICGQKGNDGCSLVFCWRVGMGLRDWVWRRGGISEGLQLTYLFS